MAATVPLLMLGASPALAHHVMGDRTPATVPEGFLSGLGHPIIGLDHLAFIVAVGLVAAATRLHLAAPAAFVALASAGVFLRVHGFGLPVAELTAAASVLLVGALIALASELRASAWLLLFAAAGLFHGYAYGESIVGAEPAPLWAYLVGLVVVQSALVAAIVVLVRRAGEGGIYRRVTGVVIGAVGIAAIAGQFIPA